MTILPFPSSETGAGEAEQEQQATPDAEEGKRQKSQATRALEICADLDLFHTPTGDPYCSVMIGDRRETFPIMSTAFRRWLCAEFYRVEGAALRDSSRSEAIGTLAGQACYEPGRPERHAPLRLAEHDGATYLDLCDNTWRQVVIKPDGWHVLPSAASPVHFRRAAGMQPLPEPIQGGTISDLRMFVNVSDTDWPLVVSWLLAALRACGPYPILMLLGEQGAAKSTSGRLLRALLDPSTAPLRSEPKDTRDLAIAAGNARVLAYDNLSRIGPDISDALCRIATGGGFTTRRLYTDAEEAIFDAMLPVLLTSITDVATRPDLLDRGLLIRLPKIGKKQRRTEAALWKAFEKKRPGILGALLTVAAAGMKALPVTKLDNLPRMADFSLWIAASATNCPDLNGFAKAYDSNQHDAIGLALEDAAIVDVLRQLLDEQQPAKDF